MNNATPSNFLETAGRILWAIVQIVGVFMVFGLGLWLFVRLWNGVMPAFGLPMLTVVMALKMVGLCLVLLFLWFFLMYILDALCR